MNDKESMAIEPKPSRRWPKILMGLSLSVVLIIVAILVPSCLN